MNPTPLELLDTMLGHLGYAFDIQEMPGEEGVVTLQVYTAESERLIGPEGETLEDLQFLLNRLLQAKDRHTPRVVVDVEHYRAMRQDAFLRDIRVLADQVRQTGSARAVGADEFLRPAHGAQRVQGRPTDRHEQSAGRRAAQAHHAGPAALSPSRSGSARRRTAPVSDTRNIRGLVLLGGSFDCVTLHSG